jgi:hypothetical protein
MIGFCRLDMWVWQWVGLRIRLTLKEMDGTHKDGYKAQEGNGDNSREDRPFLIRGNRDTEATTYRHLKCQNISMNSTTTLCA